MEETIAYWVKKVNAEYGREDKNDYCIKYFTEIAKLKSSVSLFFDFGYVILEKGHDMWGYSYIGVVSFYIDKQYRKNPKYFMKLQTLIETIAKKEKVDYIEQGSHFNTRFNDFLEKHNYKKSVYRRYING